LKKLILKELKNLKIEKENLKEMVNKLKEEYISKEIPFQSGGDYEIRNKFLGGKRDLNLKYINFNSSCSNFYIFYFILIFYLFIFYFLLFTLFQI
jgi:hypothetical protein